jgi:hypothetical protein
MSSDLDQLLATMDDLLDATGYEPAQAPPTPGEGPHTQAARFVAGTDGAVVDATQAAAPPQGEHDTSNAPGSKPDTTPPVRHIRIDNRTPLGGFTYIGDPEELDAPDTDSPESENTEREPADDEPDIPQPPTSFPIGDKDDDTLGDFEPSHPEPDGHRLGELLDALKLLIPEGQTRAAVARGAGRAAEEIAEVPGRVRARADQVRGWLGQMGGWLLYNGGAVAAGHSVPWLTGGQYPSLPGAVHAALQDCAGQYSLAGAAVLGGTFIGATWLLVDGRIRAWCATKAEWAKSSPRFSQRMSNFWFVPAWICRIPLASVAAGTAASLGLAAIHILTGAPS